MNLKEDFSIILQQKGKPPKHFEINRKKIKTFFILFPLSNIILFISMGMIIMYFSTIKTQFLLEKPILLNEFEKTKTNLQNKINNLEEINKKLTQDLIFNDGVAFSGNQFIRVLPNSKDKSPEQMIEIDSKKVTGQQNNYKVNFNITNQSIVDRVSGYFFTILKRSGTYQFYPHNIKEFKSISFKDGEYFSTSKFRPVEISFSKLELSSKMELIILIFSTEGDLIHSSAESLEVTNE